MSDLLCVKALASALGRHESYIYNARMRGFQMPGGVATVEEFREWYRLNGSPRKGEYKSRKEMEKTEAFAPP